jgi:hypothetical protein
MLALCEKEGRVVVTGLEIPGISRDGVVGPDILGEGIVRGIFEAVLAVLAKADTCEYEIDLGILNGCDLLGVLGDDDVTTLGGVLLESINIF